MDVQWRFTTVVDFRTKFGTSMEGCYFFIIQALLTYLRFPTQFRKIFLCNLNITKRSIRKQ